jgi:excinuclease ABC subunit C
VGKARNLRNRLSSYFRNSGLNAKTVALVMRIRDIQVTVTSTEADALLLEHNLIKAHKPPYNILLKDDKSYPYIFLSSRDRFPRLSIHRGPKRAKGPVTSGPIPVPDRCASRCTSCRRTFKVRQCEDSYFRNRSRPCLQYQIDRCTAPCVGLVSEEEYAEQVDKTVLFLQGKSRELMGTPGG